MNDLLTFSISGGIIRFLTFIVKPILILVCCKFIIDALLKIISGVISKSHLDQGIAGFVQKAVRIFLWIITIIITADSIGIDTTSLVALVSVVSLALSLSFQNILTNVFSGVIILLSKPFVVGDYVTVGTVSGTVREITLMRTKLATPDNKIELIPNGTIDSANVTNYSSEPLRRVEVKVAVSYDASTEAVKNAVMEIIDRDERVIRLEDKLPTVRLSAYNDSSIEYTIRVWTENAKYWDVHFDLMENIRESFAAHGIEFTYPHTIVHMQ